MNNMIQGMIRALMPQFLAALSNMPLAAKQKIAFELEDFCRAFVDGNETRFTGLLDRSGQHLIGPGLRDKLTAALWNDGPGE